jgi:hypothetical protein
MPFERPAALARQLGGLGIQRCEFEQPCEHKQGRLMLAVEVEATRLIEGGLTLHHRCCVLPRLRVTGEGSRVEGRHDRRALVAVPYSGGSGGVVLTGGGDGTLCPEPPTRSDGMLSSSTAAWARLRANSSLPIA